MHTDHQNAHCHQNRWSCPFQRRDLPTLQSSSLMLTQAVMWLLGEPDGRELAQLNTTSTIFFHKVSSYPDEFPHPFHCMTVTNSCVGKGEQIAQGPQQMVEEESGWDWFVWKQYSLMPEVLIKLQTVGSLTSYSHLCSSEVPPKSYLEQLPLQFEAYKTEASSTQPKSEVVPWEVDCKCSKYLSGHHLGGTRIRLLVCFFGLLLGTLLQDVLVCSQFVPHWEERKRTAVSEWKATPDCTDSSQTAWKTPRFNGNYKHEKTDTPSKSTFALLVLLYPLLLSSQCSVKCLTHTWCCLLCGRDSFSSFQSKSILHMWYLKDLCCVMSSPTKRRKEPAGWCSPEGRLR